MKITLHYVAAAMMMLVTLNSWGQTRYLEEVFTDADITVDSDIIYGTNINFLTSDLTPSAQLATDIGTLSAIADAGGAYPAEYYDPADVTTQVKITDIGMDVYRPSDAADAETSRPVIVYVHTGNFLPPPINGSMMGTKNDSLAKDLCMSWARRGYVAVSIDYRLGWNPIGDELARRGTLLNAVYRALQDTKMAVRYMKDNAATYGADANNTVLFGEGSGGYVTQAYVTLDKPDVELFLEKFRPDPFDATVSYIDTLAVGLPSGFGFPNSVNLYRASATSAEVNMSINAGGALADESWLEAGDVPMVSFHAIRDDFAPFTAGTVIVPTTQEEVVDVHGSNFFIQKANDLGNNDIFAGLPAGDVYTDRARSLYGAAFDASNGTVETVGATPEGLFPVEQVLRPFLTNISAPWQYWDPASALANVEVSPGITANMAQFNSNPNMSEAQSVAFQDTINGYLMPRLTCVLGLPGNPCEPALEPCDFGDIDNIGMALICDDIESYTAGGLTGQSEHWSSWGGAAADEIVVTTDYAASGTNSVQVIGGQGMDGVLRLGDQADGVYATIWKMYIPAGKSAYFNFQDNQDINPAIWNGTVFFNDGDVPAVGEGTIIVDENAPGDISGTFTYPEDEWFSVVMLFDLDSDVLELRVDGNLVIDNFAYTGNLGGINFYPGSVDHEYYIDDVAFGTDLTITVDEEGKDVFSLFPNPTDGMVTISALENIQSITITNMLGAVVAQSANVAQGNVQLDLSSYEPGLYLMSVEVDGKFYTQRIMRK